MARRERERLRMQAKFKKDQLDKVREEQNTDAATGEVLCHCPLVFAAWSGNKVALLANML